MRVGIKFDLSFAVEFRSHRCSHPSPPTPLPQGAREDAFVRSGFPTTFETLTGFKPKNDLFFPSWRLRPLVYDLPSEGMLSQWRLTKRGEFGLPRRTDIIPKINQAYAEFAIRPPPLADWGRTRLRGHALSTMGARLPSGQHRD